MNKKSKDLLKLSSLLRKLTAVVFSLGIRCINKPSEKVFLRNLHKIEPALYIFRNSFPSKITIGFRTFYCGVDTYVPPEFKNFWISDHHFLSMFLRIGSQSYSLIPYNGETYTVRFRRTSIPSYFDPEDLNRLFGGFLMIDELSSWIKLSYFNKDTSILCNQGIVFPEFELFGKEKISDMVRLHQLSCGIRRINEARSKIALELEKMLASVL